MPPEPGSPPGSGALRRITRGESSRGPAGRVCSGAEPREEGRSVDDPSSGGSPDLLSEVPYIQWAKRHGQDGEISLDPAGGRERACERAATCEASKRTMSRG